MKYLKNIFQVYVRELAVVFRDPGIVIFFLFLPLAYPIIYALIYNPELVRDVSVVVVDHDRTAFSRELARNLDATQGAWVKGYAADMAEARRAMNSHECYAIFEIPEGSGRNVATGAQATPTLFVEMSLMLRYRSLLVATADLMTEMGSKILVETIDEKLPLADTLVDGDLLPIENVSLGNVEGGFATFIMAGVLIIILHQSLILAAGMAGGARKENPAMIGYYPYNEGLTTLTGLIGKTLCYSTIMIFPIMFDTHFVPMIFSFPEAGNMWEILAFLMPMVLACIGLAFVVQGVVWERESIFVIRVVTSAVFLFISGLTWPRYAMPGFWRALSDIIPATWGVNGYIRMQTNGASLAEVRDCWINLWILAGGYMLAGYCVQRWVVRPDIARCRRFFSRQPEIKI